MTQVAQFLSHVNALGPASRDWSVVLDFISNSIKATEIRMRANCLIEPAIAGSLSWQLLNDRWRICAEGKALSECKAATRLMHFNSLAALEKAADEAMQRAFGGSIEGVGNGLHPVHSSENSTQVQQYRLCR